MKDKEAMQDLRIKLGRAELNIIKVEHESIEREKRLSIVEGAISSLHPATCPNCGKAL